MAGTIVGSVDHRLGAAISTGDTNNQEQFVTIYNFLNTWMAAQGHCSLIASNFGAGGTGMNYHDVANPAGNNAWACFSFPNAIIPFYVLIQWADNVNFGTAPGNPGLLNGAAGRDGVGVAIAFRTDGGSPWGGTTGSPGSDSKGSPVWIPGPSTLYSLMRSNATGGSHTTNLENMVAIDDLANSNAFSRLHLIGDADGFIALSDLLDDGTYKCSYAGAFTPRPGVVTQAPLLLLGAGLDNAGFWSNSITWGTLLGTGAREGGMFLRASEGVSTFIVDTTNPWSASAYQPNNLVSPPELDGSRIFVMQQEVVSAMAGWLRTELIQQVFGVANHQSDGSASRVYMATSAAAASKYSVVWDGGVLPGITNTRAGRQFTV